MAILKIARMGHPVLSKIADPVEDPGVPEIRQLVADMMETMADAGGAGLAAPQVHVSKRVVVFQAPFDRDEAAETDAAGAGDLIVLINPALEILTDEREDGWEGCLSVPGLRGLVPRYTRLRYTGVDVEGNIIDKTASGFHARVVQHECDHLDGILYPQRMTDLSQLIFESEFRHRVAQAVGADEA